MLLHPADFPYFTFANLDRFNTLRHFVTCGNSAETDINLRSVGGAANRRRLAQTIGFEIDRLVTGEQTHSLNIAVVTSADVGRGSVDIDSRIPCTDALITNRRGLCLMVLTADCVPVLLYDPTTHSAAAIHAGWRGTANDIVGLSVKKMADEFGTKPENLMAAIGPCIGTCCFEVGDDVARHFSHWPDTILRHANWPKPHIDLVLANRLQLELAGVQASNIESSDECTKCGPHRLFSHRRNQTLGRIGTGIMLI
ncbi:MAG: peptidoglycan editing factor PgeF [Salinivirgaceae bacterium]|nr:peptidoglycan editing factor PgeF [Salinivirgaceae bacterium]